MKTPSFFLLLLSLSLLSCSNGQTGPGFSAGDLEISVSQNGTISRLQNEGTGVDHLAAGGAPLLQLRIGGEYLLPQSASLDNQAGAIVLGFPDGREAQVRVEEKDTHVTLELAAITNPEEIELVVWGPYPTVLNEVIGETVGVVQGDGFAIGLQSLNPKTLGGYPWNENDAMPQIDIFESGDFTDMSEEGKRHVLYRVEAAKPDSLGSTLQAYTRNRLEDRVIENWGHSWFTAPAYDDGGIVGSKIALFGCPSSAALQTLGAIELAEELPHPMIDGKWGKETPTASAAYLIIGFDENTIDKAIEVTKQAGLRYLYHPGPFKNWGHFELDEESFPNGIAGMRMAVEKAEAQDVMVGVHTLSNFVTTDDPWVTPVPDKRLARVGASKLSADIDATQREIPIESIRFFGQFDNNNLRTAVIGEELVRYGSVSETDPPLLMDCQRGAYGTKAGPHASGDEIAKLADHAYRVFLTDAELSVEMAKNIATLFNQTGLRQISFDGLEGNRSTGMGNYGEVLFTQAWYDALDDEIKRHYIADASRTSHYFWHMYTRMNWGEPWYAGFRESQTEYRLKNQAYFRRNLMPSMLGWFRMSDETTVEDIEWMLARSAAFDAGYAFVTSFDAVENNGRSGEILDLIKRWEAARMAGAFTADQKRRMEDINNEFVLDESTANSWMLYPVHNEVFRHQKTERQPGEPLGSNFSFDNPMEEQPMGFILTASVGDLSQATLEIDNYRSIKLPGTLREGESLIYEGGNQAIRFSKTWNRLGEVPVDGLLMSVGPGAHTIRFDGALSNVEGAETRLEVRLIGVGEGVHSQTGS